MVVYTDKDLDLGHNAYAQETARNILNSGEINFDVIKSDGSYELGARMVEINLNQNFSGLGVSKIGGSYAKTF